MVAGENYGTIGGWVKADFILEWINRQVMGAPKRVEFDFNSETFSLEPKPEPKKKRRKAAG
jgi:hypothetical protein